MPRWIRIWVLSLALGVASLAVPSIAAAKPVVTWVKIEAPEGPSQARIKRIFKGALTAAAKRASFGNGKQVSLEARITELTFEERGDVLHVACTVRGRVKGGPGARSKIAFGGDKKDRAALEKQVLTMVANGLVSRLAQIARGLPAEAAQEKKATPKNRRAKR